jgi:hypothetical protein
MAQSKTQEQERFKTKDFELAFLDGPSKSVHVPDDCPGYGRELPATWTCQADCPLAKRCWEALDNGQE